MAVLAPTPKAMVSAAVRAETGLLRNTRAATARSRKSISPPPESFEQTGSATLVQGDVRGQSRRRAVCHGTMEHPDIRGQNGRLEARMPFESCVRANPRLRLTRTPTVEEIPID